MSRRDTIIIAVLINIGLLFILFSTAVGEKEEGRTSNVAFGEQMEQAPLEGEVTMPEIEADEMDQVLDKFSQQLASSEAQTDTTIPLLGETESSEMATQVVVRQGDYLEKIAKDHGISTRALMRHNSLKNARLRVGQVLKIPVASTLGKAETEEVAKAEAPKKTAPAKVAKTSKSQTANKDSGAEYYTIQRGDNPWLISLKYRINLKDLLKLNELDERSARKLKPGDRIRIR